MNLFLLLPGTSNNCDSQNFVFIPTTVKNNVNFATHLILIMIYENSVIRF